MGGKCTKVFSANKKNCDGMDNKTISWLENTQPWCQSVDSFTSLPYHAANFLLLVTSIYSTHHLIRIIMVLSCSLLTVWGWSVSCRVDTTVWNILLTIINTTRCVMRRGTDTMTDTMTGTMTGTMTDTMTDTMTGDMEALYGQVFRPLRVSRQQFLVLFSYHLYDYYILYN